MSDPFLPEPPERTADQDAERENEDVEDDQQPDVLPGAGDDAEADAADAAAEPDLFRTPRTGDRLTVEELEEDLG